MHVFLIPLYITPDTQIVQSCLTTLVSPISPRKTYPSENPFWFHLLFKLIFKDKIIVYHIVGVHFSSKQEFLMNGQVYCTRHSYHRTAIKWREKKKYYNVRTVQSSIEKKYNEV
jgi:hypothetical protein